MLSRRELLASTAALSLLGMSQAQAWFPHGFVQPLSYKGVLSGGGFMMNLTSSDDGATVLVTYDSAPGFIWDPTTSKWDNAFPYSSLPSAYQNWGAILGITNAACVAPNDKNTAYAIMGTGHILVTINRCTTWTDTGYTANVNNSPNTIGRGVGPKIVIDPANKLVVYYIAEGGSVYRTLDGFATAPTLLNGSGGVPSATSTLGGGICFDKRSGTTTLSGVTVTKGIYVGWYDGGPTAIYESRDGGANFAATSGGPPNIQFMDMSWDGVLYATTAQDISQGCYRYVTPSSTSGLTASTWTQLSRTSSSGNRLHSVAADPLNPGAMAVSDLSGNLSYSANYGTTFHYSSAPQVNRVATSVSWQDYWVAPNIGTAEVWFNNGQLMFYRATSGELWLAEGIGCWTGTPTTSADIVWDSISQGLGGLIVNEIIKPPGHALNILAWDRVGYYISSTLAEPTGDFGIAELFGGNSAVTHSGWSSDYAKNNSSFRVVTADGGLFTSTNDGQIWTELTASYGGQAGIACQTSTNFALFGQFTPVYTTDGSSFANCLFNGVPLSVGWDAFYAYRHSVCADLVNSATYYAWNAEGTSIAGLAAYSVAIDGTNKGTGYSVNQLVHICNQKNSGGTWTTGAILKVTSIDGGGGITGIAVADGNSTYTAYTPGTPYTVDTMVPASAYAVQTGGSGYSVNDTLTLAIGTGLKYGGTVQVATVDGSGAILTLKNPIYAWCDSTNLPSNPVSVSGGTGSSATINVTWPSGTGAVLDVTFGQQCGLWKSTDSAQTWSLVNSSYPTYSGSPPNAGAYAMKIQCVGGNAGHVIIGFGTTYNYGFAPYISVDGGTTLHALPSISKGWAISWGQVAPGKTYPALYVAGLCSTDAQPTQYGVFECDNFNPANPTGAITWKRRCFAPGNDIQGLGALTADPDVYGVVYVGSSANGYYVLPPGSTS